MPQFFRPRRQSDDAALFEIERRAVESFRPYYSSVADDPFASIEALASLLAGNETLVAVDGADVPVGFAVYGPLGDSLHLHQLSVDPSHGRRGIGASLVSAVLEEARKQGPRMVSLTTFRAVPFNQPFYARLGFSELPLEQAPAILRKRFLWEVPSGVDVADRVLMALHLEPPLPPAR